jgi:uncharacterized caspase-like protein
MKHYLKVVASLVALIWLTLPVMAEKRVALVIGNSAYLHVSKLPNPKNDARDIAAVLRRLKFDVVEGIDLDKAGMERSIRKFARSLNGADVALFFYAGHGLQVNGRNYLAPVTARLDSEAALDFDMVSLNLVLRQMERAKRTNLVFLDACRDNPLLKDLARTMGATRSTTLSRGLARVKTVVGTLISYATSPDQVALDGDGRNSPFTTALLKHIETPGLDIANMMITVRQDVLKLSNGKQIPWDHSSLTGRFYFKQGPNPVIATNPQMPVPTIGQGAFDYTYWSSIKDSGNIALFKSYLEQFPNGKFAAIARAKIAALAPTPAPSPDATPITPVAPVPAAGPKTRPASGNRLVNVMGGPRTIQPVSGNRRPERGAQPEAAPIANTAPIERVRRGAIAVRLNGRGGWSQGSAWNYSTRKDARGNAMKGCRKYGSGCKVLADFKQCGAVAFGKRGRRTGAYGAFGINAPVARSKAMSKCRRNYRNCKVIVHKCNAFG